MGLPDYRSTVRYLHCNKTLPGHPHYPRDDLKVHLPSFPRGKGNYFIRVSLNVRRASLLSRGVSVVDVWSGHSRQQFFQSDEQLISRFDCVINVSTKEESKGVPPPPPPPHPPPSHTRTHTRTRTHARTHAHAHTRARTKRTIWLTMFHSFQDASGVTESGDAEEASAAGSGRTRKVRLS